MTYIPINRSADQRRKDQEAEREWKRSHAPVRTVEDPVKRAAYGFTAEYAPSAH